MKPTFTEPARRTASASPRAVDQPAPPGRAVPSPLSRRSFLRTAGSLAAATLTGCTSAFGLRKCEIAADLPMPDLVAHLNRNIDLINSWRCDEHASIKLHGGPLPMPSVTASIAVERPRFFRLQGTMVTTNVVDIGSNDERFWVWVKNDEDPSIITARHDCLHVAQEQMPFPFDPDWLFEAFGMIPLDETEIELQKSPSDPKKVFLRRKRIAPDGASVELVSTVDTCAGVIQSHSLMDRRGNMLALARMSEHHRDAKTSAKIAKTIELSWPQAKLRLSIRMGAVEVNPTTLTAKQFEMPQMANCPVRDIGGDEIETASEIGRTKV